MRLPASIVLVLLVSACGGGGGGGLQGPPARIDYHVDGATGSDANPGTSAAPFQTITHALAVARSAPLRNQGDQVMVHPGSYTGATETFPLVVRPGINLLAAGTPRPDLLGGGAADPADAPGVTAAVVLRDGAQLAGFSIHNPLTPGDPGFHYGVLLAGEDAHVHTSSIFGSLHGGIRVERGDVMEIAGCNIHGHATGLGIHFAGGGKSGHVRLCNIHGNRIGVEYDAPGARLNGQSVVSGQHNKLQGNLHTDLWVAPGIQVNAGHNQWDHAPPTLTTNASSGGGVDVFDMSGGAAVDVTGAALYVP